MPYTAMRLRWLILICLGLIGLFRGMPVKGEESLKADVIASGIRLRSYAPVPLEVRLSSKKSGILEGVLDITLLDLGEPVLEQRTQPLTLISGTQNFRFMLPPPSGHTFYGQESEVALKFVSKDGAVNLGRFPLPMAGGAQRALVIAVGRETVQGEQRRSDLWQSLRLERFAPGDLKGANAPLVTLPAYLEAADFPSEPLAYCAYDIVLLEEEAFHHLREKQLSALSRWTGAGGSLCIVPGESVPDAAEKFLQELASDEFAAGHASTAGLADWRGKGAEPTLWRYGLGRVAIIPRLPQAAGDFDSLPWRQMAVFLWKMRKDEGERCLANGEWSGGLEARGQMGKATSFRMQQSQSIAARMEALLPTKFRPLPYSVIGAVLAVFLLIVGPVDYIALGWLRMRRWTWVFFPCACVAFTVLLLKLADDFMGSNDRRATVTITDLGRDGRVLRSTSLSMLMPARGREASEESRHAWVSPFSGGSDARNGRGDDHNGGFPTFEGQAPEHYVTRESLRQWTMHLKRSTSFEITPTPGILWDAFDPSLFPKNSQVSEHGVLSGAGVEENYRRMRGDTGCAFAYIHYSWTPPPPFNQPSGQRFGPGMTRTMPVNPANPDERLEFPLNLAALRAPGNDPLSQLLSQFSPTGGDSLEDFWIEDSSDPRQWLAIAWLQNGSDLQIFRKLYFTHD